MEKIISSYKKATSLEGKDRVPALDGIRVFFVLSVAAFHFWQMSWLSPNLKIGSFSLSFDPWLRSGYLWVDGMLLLSGFLLYLPYAQSAASHKPLPAIRPFYQKRLARIVPSYLLSLLVLFFLVALPGKFYQNTGEMAKDWLAHLTFTHNWFEFSYSRSPMTGVLWTLAVEMQFYLLFPFLARAFNRTPLLSYALAALTAVLFRAFALRQPNLSMLINQLPAFLDVYLNGFVAATLYVKLNQELKDDGFSRVLMSAIALVCLVALCALVRAQASSPDLRALQAGQLERRFLLSLLLSLSFLGLSRGLGGLRLLFQNRIMRFLSDISYQFYIWHAVLASLIKRSGFIKSAHPAPEQAGDFQWQLSFVVAAFLLSLSVSTLLHYGFEKPFTRLFLNPQQKRGKTK